jgi:hypothetical protein
MELNYLAIFIATILQFIFGAIWYSFLFGKLWGKIHGFDKLSKEVQQKMMKQMGPFYGIQFFVTIVTTFVLAIFITNLPYWNAYGMAGFFWLGFVVPTQVSAVIFGGTEGKWLLKKVLVQAGASLGCLMIAAAILRMMSL